jgi:Sas10 C-terminal domain
VKSRVTGNSQRTDTALEIENFSESSDGEVGEADMDAGWGGRRRMWYGGDTQDYEIMAGDEREEALRDEETEARRLQGKLLSSMRPEDFLDSDREDTADDETGGEGVTSRDAEQGVGDVELDAKVGLEVAVLVQELSDSMSLMRELQPKVSELKSALLRFHLAASFATNVAFYLALRTDLDEARVDPRCHPVVACIVQLRQLRKACANVNWELYDIALGSSGQPVKDAGDEHAHTRDRHKSVEPSFSFDQANPEDIRPVQGKKRRRRKLASSLPVESQEQDDISFEKSLTGPAEDEVDNRRDGDDAAKRRRISRMVGALERDRQNRALRRAVSGDMEAVRDNADSTIQSKETSAGVLDECPNTPDEEEDDALMQRVLDKQEKKAARLARKKEIEKPHVYTFDERIKDKNGRRRASSQIVLNRGLTRYRPRDRKTPRTKNREAFGKAVKKRRSVVRDPVVAQPLSYGGEASGINMRARKGSKLTEV